MDASVNLELQTVHSFAIFSETKRFSKKVNRNFFVENFMVNIFVYVENCRKENRCGDICKNMTALVKKCANRN